MGILEKLKIVREKDPEMTGFCIQTIRFAKLLENARALLDLFEDGNEKLLGEYILDFHYVTSLIENLTERLGMLTFDACVLAPENGESFYKEFDQLHLQADELLSRPHSHEKENTPGEGDQPSDIADPEYQLLSDVLQWVKGEGSDSGAGVLNFMKKTFFTVFQHMESANSLKNRIIQKNERIKTVDSRIYIVELWKDAVAPPGALRSLEEIESIPLKLLLMNVQADVPSSAHPHPKWIAATSEYRLSLNALTSGFRFRLEAAASGHRNSDFIFIFADTAIHLEKILPQGFYIEKTPDGYLAWSLDASLNTIENNLITIGHNLLNENASQV